MDIGYKEPHPEFVLHDPAPHSRAIVCMVVLLLLVFGGWQAYRNWSGWTCGVSQKHPATFPVAANWPAYLEYGRRMRAGLAVSSKAMRQHSYDMLRKFKQNGEYSELRLIV